MSKFKVGDKVKVVAYPDDSSEVEIGDIGVVVITPPDSLYIKIKTDRGQPYMKESELALVEENKFKVDDIVRVKNQNKYGNTWKGDMIVVGVTDLVACKHPKSGKGAFFREELELVKSSNKDNKKYFIFYKNSMKMFDSVDEAVSYCKTNEADECTIMIAYKKYKRTVGHTLEDI